MTGFDHLYPTLQHHIVSTLGWPGLRPLQDASVEPLTAGEDALLLAPTAGGKTEAASFPVLTRMATEGWRGVSVLYICPLKALLNNLEVRLRTYAGWIGRTVGIWHGDVTTSARRRMHTGLRPDILLTTPESLESMMVSTGVNDRDFLGDVKTVIIDEVHAFAGDDRGWHLSAVLSRLEHAVGHPLQRIGMSATVGNPEDLLEWLQGGARSATTRTGRVIAPGVVLPGAGISPAAGPDAPEIRVDRLASFDQVATLLSKLYVGEKRLVFVDSRKDVEILGHALEECGVKVFLSHSSLSASERARSEAAFAEETDCVIVATSTLELGIDIGNLDRVIQVGAPRTVSSFLQRLGRTGRRAGTSRNCLFIALPGPDSIDRDDQDEMLLQIMGLLSAWAAGFVEPVIPPPLPLHIAAQQFLAAALSRGAFSTVTWRAIWDGTPLMDDAVLECDAFEILDHLITSGMLETDGETAFIGEAAEKAFGRRHFMELLSAFTAAPLFTVLDGRTEIGMVEDRLVASLEETDGENILALAGRNWKIISIDFKRKIIHTEPSTKQGVARWGSSGPAFGYDVAQGMRRVVLGESVPGVLLTGRAAEALEGVRAWWSPTVSTSSDAVFLPVGHYNPEQAEWWAWCGTGRNQQVKAALGASASHGDALPGHLGFVDDGIADDAQLAPLDQAARYDRLRVFPEVTPAQVRSRISWYDTLPVAERPQPYVSPKAVYGLKFNAALPEEEARAILARRSLT
ncbi:DEAD/DEAH box helicase [Corynebacterium variabile]|uniref:Lhr-like helicases n=1 Tax=Corynebacterium variabile TaxID=1727 RepID=A0A125T598_9CORY|nr:DEAD/DEAH box helicase [Corynebacterium variabile]CUU65387.1 Lhr-like helicases [Corynebacterium variabile]